MEFDPQQIVRQTSIQHVEYHDVLDSTSLLAAELINDLAGVAPAVVVAAEQTAGRGRGSNAWWASRGALTFTVVLNADRLPVKAESRSLVSLAAGAAVRSCVAQRLLPAKAAQHVRIKWPNDVYVGEQKVCGILTELRTSSTGPMVLIGIGINVNNSVQVAPTDVRQTAVSLQDLTGESIPLNDLLIQVLNALDEKVTLVAADQQRLIDEVNSHCLLTGRQVVIDADGTITGRCIGIDLTGGLVLDTAVGQKRVLAGSIRSWR
jgi:BirA family biotin operon repressor/biotin-[acetyl-CoA-carboxylase] ligase